MYMLLDIVFFNFKDITKNYSTAVRLEHGAEGISFDRLGTKVLKTQAIDFIRESAEEGGEALAMHFMQEKHKLFIRNTELNTIELLSHCAKC